MVWRCVYLLCGVQEVLSWGAFVLGAFVLGAFVVNLLSETPKSMHFVVVLQGGAFVLITAWWHERMREIYVCVEGVQ